MHAGASFRVGCITSFYVMEATSMHYTYILITEIIAEIRIIFTEGKYSMYELTSGYDV